MGIGSQTAWMTGKAVASTPLSGGASCFLTRGRRHTMTKCAEVGLDALDAPPERGDWREDLEAKGEE